MCIRDRLELAKMLRGASGRLRCPYGIDFEEQCGTGSHINRGHRVPFWLALMELHGDGYRYGTESERHLPFVFEKVVQIVTNRRESRQESAQGASEHLLVVSDDLARALTANPIFRHKVATHDLLTYALKEPAKYLAMITTDQLQQGDIMAQGTLMPAAAAEVIASNFLDFVVKHQLADAMQTMRSEQIQVIALFLNHLLQKPPKRVPLSERLDLIQQKPTYTPADAIESPQVPHFVKVSNGLSLIHISEPTRPY